MTPRPLPPDVAGSPEDVRGHILDAAYRVIARDGLSAASTRAIASEAGVAAGTLYNYFDDRLQLVSRSILRRAHLLAMPLGDFAARAGTFTLTENLLFFTDQVAEVLDDIVPLSAAAVSEPALREALGSAMLEADPSAYGIRILEEYFLGERRLGRVDVGADCRAAAQVVVGMCHDVAFRRLVAGAGGSARLEARELSFVIGALTAAVRTEIKVPN